MELYAIVDPAVSFLTRMYGLSALFSLYIVLFVGILRVYFPRLAIHPLLMYASRGIGLSVFLFAVLHALSAYVGNLDGTLSAVLFLSTTHQLALAFSAFAFVVLLVMAVTSFDWAIKKIGFPRWKTIHRLVYLAAIAVLFHAFLIGSHFVDTGTIVPFLVMYGALTLLMLEAGALYLKYQQNRVGSHDLKTRFVYFGLILMVSMGMYASNVVLQRSVDPHAGHGAGAYSYSTDYTLEALQISPQNFEAGQATKIMFRIEKKGSQLQAWRQFYQLQSKLMHLIIVSDDLNEFHHVHPDINETGIFETEFTPLTNRAYYLFAEFVPELNTEALATARIMGSANSELPASLKPSSPVFEIGELSVTLQTQNPIVAEREHLVNFLVSDLSTGRPITGLERYLGEFGHLAVVKDDKETYVHVHPIPDDRVDIGGKISFITLFPESGNYRLYLQFKHGGQVKLAYYSIEVLP